MPSIGDILGAAGGNDSAKQLFLWGVLAGLLASVFSPITEDITQDMWAKAVNDGVARALPPELLATMVVRGWLPDFEGRAAAAMSGISPANFDLMVNNARNPIAPEEAAVALRRKIIPETAPPGQPSFEGAIQEGNLGNQWAPVIQQLAKAIPSPADVLRGVLQGQVPAGVSGRDLYVQVGGQDVDPNTGFDWYEFMFNTEGQAPTPMEALEMVNRKIIPLGDGSDGPVIEGPGAVSFWQAFLEGPWRNKWEEAFAKLRVYIPPPRTVTTLLRAGAIDVNQALEWFEATGMTPATADAYVASASSSKVTTAKNLNEAAIETLYVDKVIDEATARERLQLLGYSDTNATLILETANLRQTMANLNKNIGRIGTYYIGKHIDEATARTLLGQLALPAAQIDQLLTGWTIDRSATLNHLTTAQVATAVEYGVLTEAEGFTLIEALGYTPFDAWVIMSNRAKTPLPNRPAAGPRPVA